MLTLQYLLGVILFCGVFQLGRFMTKKSHAWADFSARRILHPESVEKVFLYGGRIFQVVAVVWGFLDAVSVLVLVF